MAFFWSLKTKRCLGWVVWVVGYSEKSTNQVNRVDRSWSDMHFALRIQQWDLFTSIWSKIAIEGKVSNSWRSWDKESFGVCERKPSVHGCYSFCGSTRLGATQICRRRCQRNLEGTQIKRRWAYYRSTWDDMLEICERDRVLSLETWYGPCSNSSTMKDVNTLTHQ